MIKSLFSTDMQFMNIKKMVYTLQCWCVYNKEMINDNIVKYSCNNVKGEFIILLKLNYCAL